MNKHSGRAYVIALIFTALTFTVVFAEDHVYESKGRRDPFMPLVGAEIKSAESLEDVLSIDDVNFQGIATGPRGKTVAILNGTMLQKGETMGRVTLEGIKGETAVIIIDGDRYALDLYEK